MQRVTHYLITLLATLSISLYAGTSNAFNCDQCYFSTNINYAYKQLNFGFLKGSQPSLNSVNFSLQGSYQDFFALISLDNSISGARIQELGIEGTVTRNDFGVSVGGILDQRNIVFFIPTSKRWILSSYGYAGYSDGRTELSYADGLSISFREAGMNFGVGASLFDAHTLSSYTISIGYAYLNNSELKFSSDIQKTTVGDTRGFSFDMSYSLQLSSNFDLKFGLKTNRYIINITTGSFQGDVEDTLNQLYLGVRYYF